MTISTMHGAVFITPAVANSSGVLHPSALEEGGDMGGDIYTCTQLTDYLNTYGVQLQYHHM